MKKQTWNVRNEKGRFVSKDYKGVIIIKDEKGIKRKFNTGDLTAGDIRKDIEKVGIGGIITEGKTKTNITQEMIDDIEARANLFRAKSKRQSQAEYNLDRRKRFLEPKEHETIVGDKDIKSYIYERDTEQAKKELRDYVNSVRKAEEVSGEVIDIENSKPRLSSEFNKRFNTTDEEQEYILNLFETANEIGQQYSIITNGLVEPKFSLKLNNIKTKDQLERRIESAKDVLRDGYIDRIAKEYMEDFKENFNGWLLPDVQAKLDVLLENINPIDFLNLIKNYKFDSLPYGIESIIDTFGYDQLERDVKAFIFQGAKYLDADSLV